MYSERKVLGKSNNTASLSTKSNAFNSERKIPEKEELYGAAYHPEI